MLYRLLKAYAKFAIKIYCRRVLVNRTDVLKSQGPLLLAANHPNSFLDGMILTTLFDQPVYSLARGDAFKNKLVNRMLRSLQLLPVYRTSEGVENLEHNYTTFAACQEAFENKGVILIFSEGKCENEWHLRPLKKGTARLAISTWQKNIPLKVVPVGFNYSSFKNFGKEVHLFFGEPIVQQNVVTDQAGGKQLLAFNEKLNAELQNLVYEIQPSDRETVNRIFSIGLRSSFFLFLLPGIAGWILHAPLFYSCKIFTHLRFRHTDHYDSVLTSLLLLLYPIYWCAMAVMAFSITPALGFVLASLLPLTAWCCVQAKYQIGI